MKRNKGKKAFALLLSLCLLAGLLPGTALAEENGSTGIDVTGQQTDQTYTCGNGTASWVFSSTAGEENGTPHTLTLSGNGTIKADSGDGISLPDHATLVVETGAAWTVESGADAYGIFGKGSLTVEIEPGASLDVQGGTIKGNSVAVVEGGYGIDTIQTLSITVAAGGSLLAVGGTGSNEYTRSNGLRGNSVTLTNNGTVLASGGRVNNGGYNRGSGIRSGGVTLSGSGLTLCLGEYGIESTGDVTIAEGVQGCAAGTNKGVWTSGNLENNNPTGFSAVDDLKEITNDQSSGLNLSLVTDAMVYHDVGGGMALWEPKKAGAWSTYPHLTLIGAYIVTLTLPAGSNEVALVGNSYIENLKMDSSGSPTFSGTGAINMAFLSDSNVSEIGIAPPPAGYYAKAWVEDGAGRSFGIPGSVFLEGNGGVYYPQTLPAKLNLTYAPVSGLRDDQHLLTVEGGYGGGVYVSGSSAPLEFTEDGSDFYGWELFDPETRESQGTTGILAHQDKETNYIMPDHHVAIRAIVEDPNPPSPPAPSLETGEHNKYLNGYPDGTIRPEGNLTRAEAAQLFYNLMDEQSRTQYETQDCPFSDVSEQSWAYQAICTLANAGILMGDPDGTFRPFGTVTRAEFSSIAARFDPGAYEGKDLFPDISTHWARNNINYAASKGWVQGYKDGTFRPKEKITRAEAATLINNVLGRAPETIDDLLPGRRIFTDNTNEKAWYYLALEEAANSHDYRRKDYEGTAESWTALG